MKEKSVDELREIVIQSFKKGSWNQCQIACHELHRRFPKDLGIALKLAEITAKMGDEGWAIQLYEQVAERCRESQNFLNAVGIYKKILEIDPSLTTPRERMEELCHLLEAVEETKEKTTVEAQPVYKTARQDIPLLTELNKEELLPIVESFKRLTFPMGSIICREGDEGRSIYIITHGAVRIFIEGVVGERIEIAQLKDGEFFGEISFFTDGKRHASVMALDDTEILEMKKSDIDRIAESHPRILDILDSCFRERVLDKLLAVSPLFHTLERDDRRDLLGHFKLKGFGRGDVVAEEGEEGASLFIIKSGRVEVSTEEGGKGYLKLAELSEGDFFGEVSLLTGKPRTATVRAVSNLEVMELSKDELMKYTDKYPNIKETMKSYLKARTDQTIRRVVMFKYSQGQ